VNHGVSDQELRDVQYMEHALALARRAEARDEVPVGALLVHEDRIVAEAWNRPLCSHDPTAHAEVLALRAAGVALANYRLSGTTLYVTLEPCVMCVGAMVHARIARLVYGAHDPKTGAAGGRIGLLNDEIFNHRIAVTGGVLAGPCGDVLSAFFQRRRSLQGR